MDRIDRKQVEEALQGSVASEGTELVALKYGPQEKGIISWCYMYTDSDF